MTFGEKLVYYRSKKNMTQKALAETLGITPTRLNYWEKGKREPDIAMVRQLAKILGVSANVLIGLENDELPETKKSPAPEGTEDDRISIEEMQTLLRALGFGDKAGNLSEKDVLFLSGVFDLLEAWFG